MILFVKKEFGILVQLIMQWLGEYAEWISLHVLKLSCILSVLENEVKEK